MNPSVLRAALDSRAKDALTLCALFLLYRLGLFYSHYTIGQARARRTVSDSPAHTTRAAQRYVKLVFAQYGIVVRAPPCEPGRPSSASTLCQSVITS